MGVLFVSRAGELLSPTPYSHHCLPAALFVGQRIFLLDLSPRNTLSLEVVSCLFGKQVEVREGLTCTLPPHTWSPTSFPDASGAFPNLPSDGLGVLCTLPAKRHPGKGLVVINLSSGTLEKLQDWL